MSDFWVNGIVSGRDHQPYIQLANEKGMIAQLTMSEARKIAHDILVMASRTEADAMIVKFFKKLDYPAAGAGMLIEFRDFRHELDMDKAEGSFSDPDTGEKI